MALSVIVLSSTHAVHVVQVVHFKAAAIDIAVTNLCAESAETLAPNFEVINREEIPVVV